MTIWTSITFLCLPQIRLSAPIFTLLDVLGVIFGCSCAQFNKNEVYWIHFCRQDALRRQFLVGFRTSEPRILQYLTALLRFLHFLLNRISNEFKHSKMVLGTLLGVSWTPLGILWGGVFGPLGSFRIAIGRPRASQIRRALVAPGVSEEL